MSWRQWFLGWSVCKEELYRRFNLVRHEDETGVIAQGVQFSNGRVVMQWTTDTVSITVFDSIEDVEAIHGHGGKTEVVWLD